MHELVIIEKAENIIILTLVDTQQEGPVAAGAPDSQQLHAPNYHSRLHVHRPDPLWGSHSLLFSRYSRRYMTEGQAVCSISTSVWQFSGIIHKKRHPNYAFIFYSTHTTPLYCCFLCPGLERQGGLWRGTHGFIQVLKGIAGVTETLPKLPAIKQSPSDTPCCFVLQQPTNITSTGLFISPSGISELDCATTKIDTAERSISIGRESLQVFFVLGALACFQVPPLRGSREEKWRSQ